VDLLLVAWRLRGGTATQSSLLGRQIGQEILNALSLSSKSIRNPRASIIPDDEEGIMPHDEEGIMPHDEEERQYKQRHKDNK